MRDNYPHLLERGNSTTNLALTPIYAKGMDLSEHLAAHQYRQIFLPILQLMGRDLVGKGPYNLNSISSSALLIKKRLSFHFVLQTWSGEPLGVI